MSMVSVLSPGAGFAIDLPLCGHEIPGTLRPATAGPGSRAGDQLETSFREPIPFTRAEIWDRFGPAGLVSGRLTDDAGSRGHGNKPGASPRCATARIYAAAARFRGWRAAPQLPGASTARHAAGDTATHLDGSDEGVAGEPTDEEMIAIGAYLASSKP